MRRLLVPALIGPMLFGMAALAGCERREARPEAPASAPKREADFRHRLEGDISGDYRPVAEAGEVWRVESLFIGQASAFEAWEAGRREASPLILTLVGPDGAVRFTPRAYALTDERLTLVAVAPGGREARLEARIDPGALATARRNLGDLTPVVSGTVTVEGVRLPVNLGWWNGD
ncbi:MAG: hypothetical protein ACK4OJ_06755 [Brevundimonas sp.]